MAESALSEDLIRAHASLSSFERGLEYYHEGAVLSLVRRGDELRAEVAGTQYPAYQVRVAFDGETICEALCDCPYDWGGWCKHIVAALLAALQEPDRVEDRPAPEALLDDLDRAQLQALVEHLADRHAALADEIEGWLLLKKSAPAAGAPPVSVDPALIRRRVRDILRTLDRMRPSEAYWHVGGVVEEVRGVLDEVRGFVEQGAAREALPLLEALTDAYANEAQYLDDSDGDVYAFFEDLGGVWAEALLAAGLPAKERRQWARRFDGWENELYGHVEGFWVARAAAEHGWDDPLLQRVLRDEPLPDDAWDHYNEDAWEDGLLHAQLNVLAWQGRHEAYLRLADVANLHQHYAVMLARLGRVDEAVQAARQRLSGAGEMLAVARALHETGAAEAALDVAAHGLNLDGGYGRAELALWVRDLATQRGETDRALQAALVVVAERPDLDAYLKAEALAGDNWSEHKAALLQRLRQKKGGFGSQGLVAIFLHEALVDDAIDAVRQGYAGYDVLRQVADAAVATRPAWVIDVARKQAEDIMDQGRSQAYHYAADWLKRAREAYKVAGRASEWQAYLAELKERHGRKYKLMPLLKAL